MPVIAVMPLAPFTSIKLYVVFDHSLQPCVCVMAGETWARATITFAAPWKRADDRTYEDAVSRTVAALQAAHGGRPADTADDGTPLEVLLSGPEMPKTPD